MLGVIAVQPCKLATPQVKCQRTATGHFDKYERQAHRFHAQRCAVARRGEPDPHGLVVRQVPTFVEPSESRHFRHGVQQSNVVAGPRVFRRKRFGQRRDSGFVGDIHVGVCGSCHVVETAKQATGSGDCAFPRTPSEANKPPSSPRRICRRHETPGTPRSIDADSLRSLASLTPWRLNLAGVPNHCDGGYRMNDQASYVCGACGEEIVIPIDFSQGQRQEFVEDCPVCCRANVIRVEVDESGEASAWAELE